MKKILLLLFISFPIFAQINVTFQANMAVQIKKGYFSPRATALLSEVIFRLLPVMLQTGAAIFSN
jgi:hypothetical protein